MATASVPAGWPAEKPLAVAVSIMLEGWTDDSAPGIGPMGNPLKPGVLDLQARSWADTARRPAHGVFSTCSPPTTCAPSGMSAASSPNAIPS